MSRLVIVLALVVGFSMSGFVYADPVAPYQEVRAEYNPLTGSIQVSVNFVPNWWVEHLGYASMTGDSPLGLPAAGGLLSNSDIRIGESAPPVDSMTYDLDLGNVAITGIPDDGTLRVFWNPAWGSAATNFPVAFVIPEPTSLALCALGLVSLTANRRRRVA